MMENKLMLSMDSESYTTLYADLVESVKDAVITLMRREANDGDGLTVTVSEDGCKTRITLSDGNLDEYFVVAEVMPMPKDFAVAWWHAYDGVGFDLKGSADTEDEAKEMLHTYVENYWKGDYDLEDYKKGDGTLVVDTGNEWEGISVIPVKLLKEVA